MGRLREWLNLQGRGSRREFNTVFFSVLFWMTGYIWALKTFAPPGRDQPLGWVLAGLSLMLAPSAIGLMAIARRLHDLDRSAGWLFAFSISVKLIKTLYERVVPEWARPVLVVLCFAVAGLSLVLLATRKGTAGDNQFGPDPLRHAEFDAGAA